MLKKILAGMLMVLALGVVVPSTAGAINPCPIGNQGWFESHSAVYHCTVDGNHVVVDRYQGNSYIQGAIDTWVTPSGYWFIGTGGLGSRYANFGVCGYPGVSVQLPGSGGSYYVVRNGHPSYEGILVWRYAQPNYGNVGCYDGAGSGQRGILY